jgi:hypothetical protein
MQTSDDKLGESGKRTAWWVNLIDDWVLVVKIGDGGWVKTLIDLNDEVDLTWLLGGGSDALDLRAGNSRGWDGGLTESACDITWITEVRSDNLNFSSSWNWTLTGLGIEKEWGFVIMIKSSVISTIGSIKSDLNGWLSEIVGLWCFACSSGWVGNISLSICSKSNEITESGVLNIKLTLILSEGFEILTSDLDDVTTFLGTSVWVNECDLRIVIIPEFNLISRLLLSIERKREWHTSLDDIGWWSNTCDVSSIMNLGWYGFCTEGATGIISILDKAFTPHLNGGSTVLRTMGWFDGWNLDWFVIEEVQVRGAGVSKVSGNRDRKW